MVEAEDWRLEYIQRSVSTSFGTTPSTTHPSPLALVEGEVGEGTRVWAWAHVMEGAKVGKNCNIGEHVFIEKGASIGDNCIIKNGVCVWENIIIEDDVFIASGVVFTNEKYTRSGYRREHLTTHVKKGATLGAGSVILPGLEIGGYATIGAGSIVTKSVISQALVYGNPTTQQGWVCECGIKLIKDYYGFYNCSQCSARYMLAGGNLTRKFLDSSSSIPNSQEA